MLSFLEAPAVGDHFHSHYCLILLQWCAVLLIQGKVKPGAASGVHIIKALTSSGKPEAALQHMQSLTAAGCPLDSELVYEVRLLRCATMVSLFCCKAADLLVTKALLLLRRVTQYYCVTSTCNCCHGQIAVSCCTVQLSSCPC
jgi:hypothetical protein